MISVEVMYRRTLDKIRKSHIGTVSPLTWNRLISDALKEFKKSFWNDYENNRATIDFVYALKVLKSNVSVTDNLVLIPSDWWKPAISEALVENNNNNVLYPSPVIPSIWIPCHELKSGERRSVMHNPFTTSNHKRVYFELRGTNIAFFPKAGLSVKEVNLEYYHVPREIWFDATSYADNTTSPLVNGYVDGAGSVNTEMSEDVKTILIEIAANIYLREIGVHSPQRQQAQ